MTTEPAVDETRRLRAVVARLAQMADYWEQELPEVIRTPAVVSAIRAALEPAAVSVVPPATNQAELRDRIRRAVCEAEGFAWDTDMLEPDEYGDVADAVLAVLPAPVDRAAVLREAADRYAELADQNEAYELAEHGSIDHESRLQYEAVRDVVAGLRRLAAEAPHTETPDARPDDDYEATTGHAITCGAGFGMGCDCGARPTEPETVHACPPDGSGLTPCCGLTPFELPRTDRISSEPAAVTCAPDVVAQPGKETDNPHTVCVCGHSRGEHVTVSGRLLCDECNPSSTDNLVCKGFEAL